MTPDRVADERGKLLAEVERLSAIAAEAAEGEQSVRHVLGAGLEESTLSAAERLRARVAELELERDQMQEQWDHACTVTQRLSGERDAAIHERDEARAFTDATMVDVIAAMHALGASLRNPALVALVRAGGAPAVAVIEGIADAAEAVARGEWPSSGRAPGGEG